MSSTQDLILEVLAESDGFSAEEIASKLFIKFEVSVSTRQVRRSLTTLCNNLILQRQPILGPSGQRIFIYEKL